MSSLLQTERLALIAEDSMSNFMYLESLLKEVGFRVMHAPNGLEAVNLAKAHKDICLILMDINMPVMDGLQATRIIKGFRKNVPIIVVTAYSSQDMHNKAYEAGCTDIVIKPVIKALFLNLIEKYAPIKK